MRKYKNHSAVICASVLFLLAGCKQEELQMYDNDPALFFPREVKSQKTGQGDSISHSFFMLPPSALVDTQWVKVQTMGELSPLDRPISIEQINTGEENAALAGIHYAALTDPEIKKFLVIKANKNSCLIPIVLLKDGSLDFKSVRLQLSVAENEHFRKGIDKFREFRVTTTAQAVKPKTWDTRWKYHFGSTWGSVKMRFIIDATGYTDWEVIPPDISYIDYLSGTTRQKFNDYNYANPDKPLKEADGTLVTFD